jgi:hypothetical protein
MASDNDNIQSENDFEDGFLGASVEVEDRGFGPQYPIVQWVNGSPKNKKQGGIAYTGGFFISAEQGISKDLLEKAGFEAYSLVTNDGTEIVGFAATDLTVSPIRYRRCWQVQADGQLARRFGWDEYDAAQEEGKPRGVAHILCAIPGLEEPVLVSFRGMTARAVMGQGKERGLIPMYGSKIIGMANRIAKAAHKNTKYPLCAFRITVGPEMDGKSPKFTEVGKGDAKNNVTLPVWRDEPTADVDKALLGRLFVGHERFAAHQDWHNQAEEWVNAWDTETLQGYRTRRSTKSVGDAEGKDSAIPGENSIVF